MGKRIAYLSGPVDAEQVYRESSPRDFRREFVLDPSIDTSKLNATIEQGVLTVTLPKTEKVKPRKIQITAGDGKPKMVEAKADKPA